MSEAVANPRDSGAHSTGDTGKPYNVAEIATAGVDE